MNCVCCALQLLCIRQAIHAKATLSRVCVLPKKEAKSFASKRACRLKIPSRAQMHAVTFSKKRRRHVWVCNSVMAVGGGGFFQHHLDAVQGSSLSPYSTDAASSIEVITRHAHFCVAQNAPWTSQRCELSRYAKRAQLYDRNELYYA
jgi:hypothetical protein